MKPAVQEVVKQRSGRDNWKFIVAETETNGSVQAIEREPVFRIQEV